MPHDPVELGRLVVDRCLSAGFALAGVCDAAPSDWEEAYREWIAAGKQGEMGYLARNVEKRLDPRELVPGARSVIVVADQYGSRNQEPAPVKTGDGRVARYAQGADYHVVMKERLHAICDALRLEHPGHEFRAFVDTAPVLEREHALRAGLGWIGKNTLLIHPQLGSWLFLGGILTTLEVRLPPEQEGKGPEPDHCGTCTRCIDACPTAAISPGPERSIDARRCISYLTIEHRSAIAPELAAQMGEWLYGCDVCQEVCPHNSPRSAEVDVGEMNPAYSARSGRGAFDLLEVLGWTEEDRRRALAGSAMKRASLEMFRRNAGVVRENAERIDDHQRARGT